MHTDIEQICRILYYKTLQLTSKYHSIEKCVIRGLARGDRFPPPRKNIKNTQKVVINFVIWPF